jgi:hypothetical protein
LKNYQIHIQTRGLTLLACAWLGAACGSGHIEAAGGSGAGAPSAPGNASSGDGSGRGTGNDVSGDRGTGSNGSNGDANSAGDEGSESAADDGSGSTNDPPRSRGGGGGSSVRRLVEEDLVDAGLLQRSIDAANDPRVFTQPRAGVALKNGSIAFVGLDESIAAADRTQVGARSAVFLQRRDGVRPQIVFNGNGLVSPVDIDVSLDEKTLFVADFAGGSAGFGAIAIVPVGGGSASFAAEGFLPRSVTVAPGGEVFFSGVDPVSGQPGVFELDGASVTPVFTGAPLLDPSGIAAFGDGRLLVADTGAFDAGNGPVLTSQGKIVLIDDGQPSEFASGFATGFPAGIALSVDENTLIVSAEARDRSDTLLLFDVANPAAAPRAVTASFSAFKDAAAGLKRAHTEDTFTFASLAANGGTVFRIEN